MKTFCDVCEKTFEIDPQDLPEYLVLEPKSGAQIVMCASCQSGPTPVAADSGVERCPKCEYVTKNGYCPQCNRHYAPSR